MQKYQSAADISRKLAKNMRTRITNKEATGSRRLSLLHNFGWPENRYRVLDSRIRKVLPGRETEPDYVDSQHPD